MISQKLHARVQKHVSRLQQFVDRYWYHPLVAILAALDNFLVVIPTGGILISSSMLRPKRWWLHASAIAFGSTIGAVALAALVQFKGLPFILELYPAINQEPMWQFTEKFFEQYGIVLVFAVALSPFFQQPTIILASLALTPMAELAAVLFAGRFVQFAVLAYIGSHTPKLLGKLWGVKGELQDAGIDLATLQKDNSGPV